MKGAAAFGWQPAVIQVNPNKTPVLIAACILVPCRIKIELIEPFKISL
jgi:hypothetical protein